jgi:hypothetical protein
VTCATWIYGCETETAAATAAAELLSTLRLADPRHKKYADRTVTPTIFHCVRAGDAGSIFGVRPDRIRRVMLKRAVGLEPEICSRQKFWSGAPKGTEVSCNACRAIMRKALRPKLRRRPLKTQAGHPSPTAGRPVDL